MVESLISDKMKKSTILAMQRLLGATYELRPLRPILNSKHMNIYYEKKIQDGKYDFSKIISRGSVFSNENTGRR